MTEEEKHLILAWMWSVTNALGYIHYSSSKNAKFFTEELNGVENAYEKFRKYIMEKTSVP